MTATPPDATRPAADPTAAPDRDPAVANLFRMSRTAGVGLQDYSAVNPTAVAGFVAGAISVAALIFADTRASLFVPLVAALLCVAAIVQIRRSGGTQTGTLLASGGLALALVFAGLHVAGWAKTSAEEARWKGELDAFIKQVVRAADKPDEAYAMFEPRFRSQINRETFGRIFGLRMSRQMDNKPITGASVDDIIIFEPGESGGTLASTLVAFTGDEKTPDGQPVTSKVPTTFYKEQGQGWKIRTIPDWFGEIAKPAAPAANAAAAAPN